MHLFIPSRAQNLLLGYSWQSKTKPLGKYDSDRWDDIEFQKGQSKAIRNAVIAGIPRWLTKEAVKTAQHAERDGISKSDINEKRKKAIDYFKKQGVSEDQIKSLFGGIAFTEWGIEEIEILRGFYQQIEDGESLVNST